MSPICARNFAALQRDVHKAGFSGPITDVAITTCLVLSASIHVWMNSPAPLSSITILLIGGTNDANYRKDKI